MGRVYMAVDFENIDTNVWWTAAFVICHYPSGDILEEHLFYADRSKHQIESDAIKCFWDNNIEAFEHNQSCANREPLEEEKKMCLFIEDIKKRMPYFFLVSDHPTFDIHILDDILVRHGKTIMSNRSPTMFRQPLDCWSYSLNLAHILNTSIKYINDHPRALATSLRTDRWIYIKLHSEEYYYKHIALNDTYRMLVNFFRILDITQACST